MARTEGVKVAVEAAVASFFYALPTVDFSDTKRYMVEEAFGGKPYTYWVNNVRPCRFERTLKEGILYRPTIVDEICAQISVCLSSETRKGLMIKGAQGTGKSHSLVNVVRKLHCSGNYLVTFFPDCEWWTNTSNFLDTVCASFGTNLEDLGIDTIQFPQVLQSDFVDIFIKFIDTALEKLGKQWVFVFDQINKLFVKPDNLQANDASGLAFPFSLISTVMKRNRITSVVSASSNNELAYKDRHEGFNEYEHRTDMTSTELLLAFGDQGVDIGMEEEEKQGGPDMDAGIINEYNIQDVIDASGGVPLYARICANNPDIFQSEMNAEVYRSIEGLSKEPRQWNIVSESIYAAILGTSTDAAMYDKKFLLRRAANESRTRWKYIPLLPAAASAYRQHLWKELMDYVESKEANLLEVCRDGDTTNDTRGRLFELIAIRRCQTDGVQLLVGNETVNINSDSERFEGKVLPSLTPHSKQITYVPADPNFPAIDWIWVCGNTVIAVQAHVSNHKDVKCAFWGMCISAGWFKQFTAVHLIYLSPEDATVNLVETLVIPPTFQGRIPKNEDTTNGFKVNLRALSRSSVSCLKNLQWPDGCSL
jgi:hypothetical protein